MRTELRAQLKLVTVALLGFGVTAILLAGLSAHAEPTSKTLKSATAIARWDSEKGPKGKGKL